MSSSPDVAEFDRRAQTYDDGRLGRWHHRVVSRSADVAMASAPVPRRALDIGCGTGGMLVEFAVRLPAAVHVGLDPAPAMAARAQERSAGRAQILRAGAEALPFSNSSFDLIVSTLSFDHWVDRDRGLGEITRVLTDDGFFVLADLCGWWLRNGGGIRHRKRIIGLAARHGLELDRHETIYRLAGLPLVQAFVFAR